METNVGKVLASCGGMTLHIHVTVDIGTVSTLPRMDEPGHVTLSTLVNLLLLTPTRRNIVRSTVSLHVIANSADGFVAAVEVSGNLAI